MTKATIQKESVGGKAFKFEIIFSSYLLHVTLLNGASPMGLYPAQKHTHSLRDRCPEQSTVPGLQVLVRYSVSPGRKASTSSGSFGRAETRTQHNML